MTALLAAMQEADYAAREAAAGGLGEFRGGDAAGFLLAVLLIALVAYLLLVVIKKYPP